MLLLGEGAAAEGRADETAHLVAVFVFETESRVVHGLARRGHRELREAVQPAGAPAVQVPEGVEVAHLRGDLRRKGAGVEAGDAVHGGVGGTHPQAQPLCP